MSFEEYYINEAKNGNIEAMANLATSYYEGDKLNQSYEKAFYWFKEAAQNGHILSQRMLGDCYRMGKGVDRDMSEAVCWYRKAASQGDARAQYLLGECYYWGRDWGEGVDKDMSEAVYWYRKAAEQELADAQYELGNCYHEGEGVKKDMSEAVYWYRKAAEQGFAEAQYKLGNCYHLGEGVDKDMSEAVCWYRKAAEQGDSQAQQELSTILSKQGKKGGESHKMLYTFVAIALVLGGHWLFSHKSAFEHKDDIRVTTDGTGVADETEAGVGKEELVKKRLTQIYDEVFSKCNDEDPSNDGLEDSDDRWLTTEFKDLLKREKEVNPDGMLGYIDYDHWLQAQDYYKPSMTIESVEMLSDTKAISNIKVIPFSNSDPKNVKVTLKYERNNWYIDDFSSRFNASEKEVLKEFIANVENYVVVDTIQMDTIPLTTDLLKEEVLDFTMDGSFGDSECKDFHIDGNTGWYTVKENGVISERRTLNVESYNENNGNLIIKAYLNDEFIGIFEGLYEVFSPEGDDEVKSFSGTFTDTKGEKLKFDLYEI